MKTRSILTALATMLIAFSASAGLVQPQSVQVDLAAMSAQGDMVTARFSNNDVEFIGCGTRDLLNPDGSLTSFGFCQAQTADEVQMTCFTFDTALVDKINNSNDFSFVTFNWNADDECIRVGFSTQSFYLPLFVRGRTDSGR